jgi:hypothetical protein
MNCREFKSLHVGYIDDVLPAADMAEMRRHIGVCVPCGNLDVRIRRSLLVMRNLPQIEPSADFFVRLNLALQQAPAPAPARQPVAIATTFLLATTAIAAAVYFAMAIGVNRTGPQRLAAPTAVAASTPAPASLINDAALVAAVPAGVPVWPAMFMVGELPMQMANAELLENGIGR